MREHVLRAQPWLQLYNYNNITGRIGEATRGDMFFAYNRKTCRVELHSIRSFFIDPQRISKNAALDPAYLNDWIIKDYRSSETRRFLHEKEDERLYQEEVMDRFEEDLEKQNLQRAGAFMEDMLGRKL